MRIWSLHPKHLDSKGLVALWRETLLAKHVLEGKTAGYTNHPQLDRFKQSQYPLDHVNQYLFYVYEEANRRGYNFNEHKFEKDFDPGYLTVTSGQMNYETTHLSKKLEVRNPKMFLELMNFTEIEPHPLFKVIEGNIEGWESLKIN